MKAMMVILTGSALVALAHLADAWYVTALIGAVIPLVIKRGGHAVLTSLVIGILGWGLPLLWVAPLATVVKLATLLGGILGLSGMGATIVGLLLPSLTGALLAVAGAWVVVAVKSVFATQMRSHTVPMGTITSNQ
jgi:hypothetical protein